MSNGLTYFKLKSPYPGDITKNCSLDGTEVDGNFFVLEGRDIKKAYWENSVLVLELMNGEYLRVEGITEGCAKDLKLQYDAENGSLYVTYNGYTETITGFTTSNGLTNVYSNDTLEGNGTPEKPLSISKLHMTGVYRPVNKVIDCTRNEKLPDDTRVNVGNRYLTIENVSDYGYLYDYNGVIKIACDLRDSSSEWRIPTKADWDDLLNSVEPCIEDRNHDKVTSNRYLGRYAGKILKSIKFWDLEQTDTCTTDMGTSFIDINNSACAPKYENSQCTPYYGQYVTCSTVEAEPYPNKGIDKYGFGAVPAGYGDDGGRIDYFGERGWYWTATNQSGTNAYAKRFEYNKSNVYQEIISTNNTLSLRLVKDYNGSNYKECENILGTDYTTVLMPSLKNGKSIWTSVNVSFTNKYYNPILPNNGMNLTYTKKFFINEWDGSKWIKNEVKNGESVVVLSAPNGNDCVEYRIINNELANVTDSVYDQVIETLNPKLDTISASISSETVRAKEAERLLDVKIDTETARAVNAENGILDQLANEISRAQQAEESLQEKINSIESGQTTDLSELNKKIDDEIARATEAEDVLDAKISSENERAETKENELDKKISDETERATYEEMLIQENLNNEINRATQSENSLNEKISNEEARAEAKESELDKKISDETERATAAEEFLRTSLNEEISRSTQKDEELDGKIVDETNRAESAENELSNRIDSINTSYEQDIEELNTKIDNEIQRSTEKDNEIEESLNNEIERSTEQDKIIIGRLIAKNGSVMNTSDGTLTLATEDSSNVVIELDFNFGEI